MATVVNVTTYNITMNRRAQYIERVCDNIVIFPFSIHPCLEKVKHTDHYVFTHGLMVKWTVTRCNNRCEEVITPLYYGMDHNIWLINHKR